MRSSEPDVPSELHNTTFEQWLDNAKSPKYTITRLDGSVWARDDVLPSMVFYEHTPHSAAWHYSSAQGLVFVINIYYRAITKKTFHSYPIIFWNCALRSTSGPPWMILIDEDDPLNNPCS